MAFVLKQSDSYHWPVEVSIPVDGRFEKQTFDIEFRRVSQPRINELAQLGSEGAITDRQTCIELVVGWRGITDGTAEIPFSQDALGQLLDMSVMERAILVAWGESLSGAKRKN